MAEQFPLGIEKSGRNVFPAALLPAQSFRGDRVGKLSSGQVAESMEGGHSGDDLLEPGGRQVGEDVPVCTYCDRDRVLLG
jgi:hypothetical protein